MQTNDFKLDLQYATKDKMFNKFYKSIGVKHIQLITDMKTQKRGIDKVLYFDRNTVVTVDEKKRRHDYGDMLIEVVSNIERDKAGWIYYTEARMIMYCIESTRTIHAIDFRKLQELYFKNKYDWDYDYMIAPARNKNYTTQNIAVPWWELLTAIHKTYYY